LIDRRLGHDDDLRAEARGIGRSLQGLVEKIHSAGGHGGPLLEALNGVEGIDEGGIIGHG